MARYKYYFRRFAAVGVIFGLLCSFTPALAATKPTAKTSTTTSSTPAASNSNISNSVTQSYNADPGVQTGMIVELKAKDPTTVVPLPDTDVKHLLGIVIPQDQATIVLAPQSATQQQVLVASKGHYSILVSNQNGLIKVGDYLAISAIDGVSMAAQDSQAQIIGKAAGNFSGTANVIGSTKLKDSTGHESTVAIGRISIDLSPAQNPLYQKASDAVPGFLAANASTIAHKPVSVARIYLCMALLLLTCVIVASMLFSGVRSGMIAVGRNPLSKKSIIKSLIQTIIAGVIVFAIGVSAVYLLLKL